MIDKKAVPTKLLWVDLEMTGLDAEKDVILEVAAEITDFDFKTLASYEALVGQKKDVVVDRMQKNIWWADYPANRDEFVNKLDSGKPSAQVEQELIQLVQERLKPHYKNVWLVGGAMMVKEFIRLKLVDEIRGK